MAGGMLMFGDFGVTVVSGCMSQLIMTLTQGCSYIEYISPSIYLEVCGAIEMFVQWQLEIEGDFKVCKNNLFPLAGNCGHAYGKLAKFLWWFAYYFNLVIVTWCDICSADPDFCENPFTTTTMSTVISIFLFQENIY